MKGITEFKGYVSQLGFDALEGKFVYNTLQPAFTAFTEMPTTPETADVKALNSGARPNVLDGVKLV